MDIRQNRWKESVNDEPSPLRMALPVMGSPIGRGRAVEGNPVEEAEKSRSGSPSRMAS